MEGLFPGVVDALVLGHMGGILQIRAVFVVPKTEWHLAFLVRGEVHVGIALLSVCCQAFLAIQLAIRWPYVHTNVGTALLLHFVHCFAVVMLTHPTCIETCMC